jgi:hypothetical protein
MLKNTTVTTNGKKGGNLIGKPHRNKDGKSVGGIKAIVTDANSRPVELEGGEVIINKEASKLHWEELSRINQSAGGGVPINKPRDPHIDNSTDFESGGKIEFNANKLPNKWILSYAKKIKDENPKIWLLDNSVYGNAAFENLLRVSNRGYWLDSEKWFYMKWQNYVLSHNKDFKIAGVVAMLKWIGKVDKGWQYMKNLIDSEIKSPVIAKKEEVKVPIKRKIMAKGGQTLEPKVIVNSTKSLARTQYFVGDIGFYNGKTRVPMVITKITNKNVYFEHNGKERRSEKHNFDKLYEASGSTINKPVSVKPTKKTPKPNTLKKQKPQPALVKKVNDGEINYYDLMVSNLKESNKEVIEIKPEMVVNHIFSRFTLMCRDNIDFISDVEYKNLINFTKEDYSKMVKELTTKL